MHDDEQRRREQRAEARRRERREREGKGEKRRRRDRYSQTPSPPSFYTLPPRPLPKIPNPSANLSVSPPPKRTNRLPIPRRSKRQTNRHERASSLLFICAKRRDGPGMLLVEEPGSCVREERETRTRVSRRRCRSVGRACRIDLNLLRLHAVPCWLAAVTAFS